MVLLAAMRELFLRTFGFLRLVKGEVELASGYAEQRRRYRQGLEGGYSQIEHGSCIVIRATYRSIVAGKSEEYTRRFPTSWHSACFSAAVLLLVHTGD